MWDAETIEGERFKDTAYVPFVPFIDRLPVINLPYPLETPDNCNE